MSRLPEQILHAIRQVVGEKQHRVGLHEPWFEGNEWKYVKECLDTRWVSSGGAFVDQFEEQLATFTEAGHVVAVVNGTAALHIALLLAGVEQGDEVLMPALTFVATANAVMYCGAVPHFVDSEIQTLGIDPEKLNAYLKDIAVRSGSRWVNKHTGRCLRALLPVHTFGHPADLDRLVEVCKRFGLVLVEDAAEGLGSFYRGQHVGRRGKVAVLSFNGNKTITTGGGGALLTQDVHLARRAKHLTTTAKVRHAWNYVHDHIGFNYRLPNLNAALGCAQLEQLPMLLKRKRALAAAYEEVFADVEGVSFVREPDFARSNYWLNALLLTEEHEFQLEAVLQLTNEAGLGTRPAWTLMNKLPMYRQMPAMDLSVAEDLARRLLNIPSSAFLMPQAM